MSTSDPNQTTNQKPLPAKQIAALDLLRRGAAAVADQHVYLALLKKGLIVKRKNTPWLCDISAAGKAALRAAKESV